MDTLSQLRTGKLAHATRLDLSAGLTALPEEILALAETLEVLDISGNALCDLPADFARLRKLRILFCSNNRFTHLPEVLGEMPQLSMVGFKANQIRHVPGASLPPALRWLILTDNAIDSLPDELGRRGELQKLMLAGNQLSELPESMAACGKLELLRLAANRFASLPAWLFTLPRLAWLAYAGNPCCDGSEAEALARNPIGEIAWDSLAIGEQLGEGASGRIFKAALRVQARSGDRPVAVKLYKGAVTSDGLPRSEMTACIAADGHPNVIAVEGRVRAHPAGADGLVMPLIDPSFRNLAGPPSLASCTRDVYAPETRFTPTAALRIAHGIASAARHLHARGIMHGDLYAHNTLVNERGDCLLGDFGAASFFSPQDSVRAKALQRIEARAFACLLEELLERCDGSQAPQAVMQEAWAWQARCADEDPAARPAFAEIQTALEGLLRRI